MLKQEVLELIKKLPDSVTMEEIMYQLYILEKHKNAMTAIENGEVLTVDEVKRLLIQQ